MHSSEIIFFRDALIDCIFLFFLKICLIVSQPSLPRHRSRPLHVDRVQKMIKVQNWTNRWGKSRFNFLLIKNCHLNSDHPMKLGQTDLSFDTFSLASPTQTNLRRPVLVQTVDPLYFTKQHFRKAVFQLFWNAPEAYVIELCWERKRSALVRSMRSLRDSSSLKKISN